MLPSASWVLEGGILLTENSLTAPLGLRGGPFRFRGYFRTGFIFLSCPEKTSPSRAALRLSAHPTPPPAEKRNRSKQLPASPGASFAFGPILMEVAEKTLFPFSSFPSKAEQSQFVIKTSSGTPASLTRRATAARLYVFPATAADQPSVGIPHAQKSFSRKEGEGVKGCSWKEGRK